jgi:hypothetical protein
LTNAPTAGINTDSFHECTAIFCWWEYSFCLKIGKFPVFNQIESKFL